MQTSAAKEQLHQKAAILLMRS